MEDELLVNPVDATQAEDTALQEALESDSLKQALQQRLEQDQMTVKQLQAAQAVRPQHPLTTRPLHRCTAQ